MAYVRMFQVHCNISHSAIEVKEGQASYGSLLYARSLRGIMW